jgi:hypothetical protein
MIPADGIGKEVIPVSVSREGKWRARLIDRLPSELSKLLDLLCPRLNSFPCWLDGKSSTRMEKLFLTRLSGRF